MEGREAGRRETGVRVVIAGLPYDAEVEYIDSVVPAYIDTGVPVSGDLTAIICDAAFLADASVLSSMLGSENDYYGLIRIWASANKIEMSWSGWQSYYPLDALGFYERHIFMFTPSGCFVDGTQISTGYFHGSTKPTIKIAGYNTGNTQRQGRCRYWGVKILGGDEQPVRDMIPVRFTNSNGQSEGAMYDRVSRKLFRNAGAGSFTIGPDVATPVMGLHFMKLPKKTAKNYVQDGLIAMWDGIENAGWGVHDAAATTWKDLIGNRDLGLYNANFSENALSRAARAVGYLAFANQDPTAWVVQSVEFCCDLHYQNYIIPFSVATSDGRGRWSRYVSARTYDGAGLQVFGANTSVKFQNPFARNVYGTVCFQWDVSAGTTISAYFDGSALTESATLPDGAGWPATDAIALGSNSAYNVDGSIYSVRCYSRALTAAEIAANYAVDKERFNLP